MMMSSCLLTRNLAHILRIFAPGPFSNSDNAYGNMSTPFKFVNKFLGIPLTAPVTGELRFKTPQPPVHWSPSVCRAETHGNVCFQPKRFEFPFDIFSPNFVRSEDCLYLDVYTPNISMSLPVMVYIHGGSYETGSPFIHPCQWHSGCTGSGSCGDPVSSRSISLFNHLRFCVL